MTSTTDTQPILSPSDLRKQVLGLCNAYAAAVSTNNAYVINAVSVAIEMVDLPRLIPDAVETPAIKNDG